VSAQALPEGEIDYPVRGFLYFPFTKPSKKVKTAELIYDGPMGKIRLKLK
jgi:hypothetical protein